MHASRPKVSVHPNAQPGMAGPDPLKPSAVAPWMASQQPEATMQQRPKVSTRVQHSIQSGFTLIEILVVALIIGILATTFSFSIGSRSLEDRLQSEAQRLNQLLVLALEEAETKGVQIGFRYTAQGYEFLAIGADGLWNPIEGTGPLRARELSAPFIIQLRVEGRVIPPAIGREFEPDQPLEPQLLLLSSGEVTPFLLWLSLEKQQESGHLIRGTLLGEITLLPWTREAWAEQETRK